MTSPRHDRAERGFTLIELMVCTALAMLMAGVAISAFVQTRKLVERSEARLAIYTSAQRLYTHLNRTFASVQQTCALVVRSTSGSPGTVQLVFMRAKESNSNFGTPVASAVNPDLVWEQWVWTRSTATLKRSASSDNRSFKSGTFTPSGVDYSGKTFQVAPQPRRVLDPANPLTQTMPFSGPNLDDNVLFPNGSNVSKASAAGDLSDWGDLSANLVPVLDQVTDLSLEIVANDGSVLPVDDSTNATRVFNGTWPDGRLAAGLGTIPDLVTQYPASDVAKRPKLIRMRLTLADQRKAAGLSCTFSFSFALPGLMLDQ